MSMSELINLSLDEIIARGGAKFRTNFRRGARRGGTTSRGFRGGTQRIPVITNRRTQSSFNFSGSSRDNNMCIVNISNLGPMVTTADLQELFINHPYEDVSVQYEPDGRPSGTAVVLFKRFEDGMRLKREFSGIRLDGKMMDLYVLTKNDFTQGPSVGRITKRATTGARFGRGMTRRQGSAIGRPRNEPRKQVTSEELDRELDAYMRGSKHPKVSPP